MKSLILLISLILCTNLTAQKSGTVKSVWHSGTEGYPSPSESEYFHHLKGKFDYYISNNNEYIYLLLKFPGKDIQTKILKSGMTLWISMDNKPSKKMGVHYPIGSDNSGSRLINSPDSENVSNDTLISTANTIELVGFISEEARKFASDNSDNFSGSVNTDKNNILHYMMRMPAAKLPLRNSKDGHGAMPFTFGIEIGSGKNGAGYDLLILKNIKLSAGS